MEFKRALTQKFTQTNSESFHRLCHNHHSKILNSSLLLLYFVAFHVNCSFFCARRFVLTQMGREMNFDDDEQF